MEQRIVDEIISLIGYENIQWGGTVDGLCIKPIEKIEDGQPNCVVMVNGGKYRISVIRENDNSIPIVTGE